MRAKAGLLILLGLYLCIGTASAFMADSAPVSTVGTGKVWIVANTIDVSEITVVAQNTSKGFVPNAVVTFTVNDPAYGFFPVPTVTTDAFGLAKSNFKAKTRSGTAVITATILSDDGYTTVLSVNQQIDHSPAQHAVFDNPAKLPVGTVSDLHINLTDRYGNLIDNRNPAENHTFTIYMPGGGGRGFWDGSNYVPVKKVGTDASGQVTIQYRIADSAVSNWIYMDTIGNMVMPPETWIEGIPLDVPYFIHQVHPSPDDIAADGIEQFGLYFYVYDKFMNPVNGTRVHITASDGSLFDELTNTLGSVFVTFGPKDTSGVYNITAIVMDNASALCTTTGITGACIQNLSFHNTEPVDLIVSANPQGMASLDIDGTIRGTVLARVVDVKGNSVIGETVRFTMGIPTYPGGPYNETSAPTISPASTPTALGGYATATFTPGAFATISTPDAFNETATGQVTVTATWTDRSGVDISREVTFVWKNYPYVSITVPQDTCEDVKVGDHINVTVSLFGDGAALRPKPIDVVLVNDRSGSMLYDNPDRMVALMEAAILFNSKMDDSRDRVGLVSFGDPSGNNGWADLTGTSGFKYGGASWAYIDSSTTDDATYIATHYPANPKLYGTAQYAFVDQPLTANPITNAATINAAINGMVPAGGTPTREGLYRGIREIIDHKRARAVSAIILLTDGDCNTGGGPRGGTCPTSSITAASFPDVGTGSVITYAAQNNITVYTIGLGSSVQTAELTSYANETGGKYYPAPSPSDLNGIYTSIAGDLQDTAGGNTQVSLDYGNVKVNGITDDILDYMEYIPDIHMPAQETDSTFVKKNNMTDVFYTYSRDDSANWSSKQMNFDVGEIRINESWSSTFRLNLTKAGKVELFGIDSDSKIAFTDASTGITTYQFLPSLQCNIQQSILDIPFGNKYLSVDNLSAANTSADPNILTIKWNTTYNGEKTVQETVSYKRNIASPAQHYVPVPGGILFESNCLEKTSYLTVDTTTWPDGWYYIQVVGVALDAANPGAVEVQWLKQGKHKPPYIKLE